MHSIEKKAIGTYQSNLNYFAQEHPEVYRKLTLLNMAIEQGQYKERYALEYKDSYFDIQELKSGQYLYAADSNKISEQVAKQVNFSRTDNVIETFYNHKLTKESAKRFNDTLGVLSDPLYATASIIYYTTNTIKKEHSSFKRIEKYIYFGIGTGKHIELIQSRIAPSKVLIVEDDIELFRLSLFVLDYKKIFTSSKTFYSIAEDKLSFKATVDDFFLAGYNHNQYIKYTIFCDSYVDKIKDIQNIVVGNPVLSYPYSIQLMNLIKTPEYLVEGYRYLNVSKNYENSIFSQKPVLLVAAGPSLEKHIAWLKANQDRFIIVSVLASLQTLHKHNIKPDILVNIDAHITIQKFFKGVDIKNFLQNTKFIFSSMVHKKLAGLVPKENLYIFEVTTNYKIDFSRVALPSVGETTYALLVIFGIQNLYLLGLDLALDPDTKQYYANTEHEPSSIKKDEKEVDIYNTNIQSSLIQIKGNFLDSVPTTPLLLNSVFAFADISKNRKKNNQNIYNLNNGAFLEGSIPCKIDSIKVDLFDKIEKPLLTKEMKNFLDSISEDTPSDKDIKNMQDSVKEAVRLFYVVKDGATIKSFSSIDSYMIYLSKLINELIRVQDDKKYDINIIMHDYMRYLSKYIFDFFNTKELTNNKKHIKHIHKMLLQQLAKMLKVYIDTLKIYIVFAKKKREDSKT